MAEVVGFHLNRGVLATADRVSFPPAAELLARARSVAVLEGVGDHENLGAVFRNAAALGVDAVLLAPGCADPLYRRSVRVSMGTVLGVPFAPLPWLDEGITLLRDNGFRIVALTPAGELTLREAVPGGRVAIMVGSEGPGLTPAALRSADMRVRIPMSGGVDSLNVATAAAIAFAWRCVIDPVWLTAVLVDSCLTDPCLASAGWPTDALVDRRVVDAREHGRRTHVRHTGAVRRLFSVSDPVNEVAARTVAAGGAAALSAGGVVIGRARG